MLPRNTEWRQGAILSLDSAYDLKLLEKGTTDQSVIVISHDCDLPHEKEEEVEIIIGKIISNPNSIFTAARHSRCLHISYKVPTSFEIVWIELQYSGRKSIPKNEFSARAKPETILSSEDKIILKQWLAARYGRPAFPNEFEKRLRKNNKFETKLTKIVNQANDYLISIFFDLGEDRSSELSEDKAYSLRISLVYETLKGTIAREFMDSCANSIEELFHSTFGTPNIAVEIILESCQSVGDTFFSLADIRKTDQWQRFDHISLRETPMSPHFSF